MDSPASILRRYGLRAKKSWGQCFLHDACVVNRIAEAAGINAKDTVIEIGAGLGALTQALAVRAKRVLAIERDRDLAHVLRQELALNPRVEVREENALTFDFNQVSGPALVVGNLPYNIASPLLFHLLEERRSIRCATVMLQREVADRLVAEPGSKTYGVPSVLCQHVCDVHICFLVPSAAFFPRPKVQSAVVRLDFLPAPRVDVDENVLRQVVRAAFQRRRKTLRRALAATFSPSHVEEALANSAIDGRRRGETLSLEEFGRLARTMGARQARESAD